MRKSLYLKQWNLNFVTCLLCYKFTIRACLLRFWSTFLQIKARFLINDASFVQYERFYFHTAQKLIKMTDLGINVVKIVWFSYWSLEVGISWHAYYCVGLFYNQNPDSCCFCSNICQKVKELIIVINFYDLFFKVLSYFVCQELHHWNRRTVIRTFTFARA